MALMKCPECGRDVSSSAASCPTCGYPIQEYIKKQEYDLEVKHLTKKIVHVQFVCPEPRAKVCIKCGRAYNEYDRQNCDCGYPFAEIDYPAKQAAERTLSTALYMYNTFLTDEWENVWYNYDVTEVKLSKIVIEFMDGSSATLTGDTLQQCFW